MVAIIRLPGLADCSLYLRPVDEILQTGDFFETGDFEALLLFKDTDEISGIQQAVERASVELGIAAAYDFDIKFASFQIDAIDVSDFQLATR